MTLPVERSGIASQNSRGTFLFVSSNESAPWGASEETWSLLARRFAADGMDVVASVRGWDPPSPRISEVEVSGCRVLRRWEDPDDNRPIFELPYSEKMSRTIESVKPRLAFVSQGDNFEGLGWMEECLKLGVPYIAYAAGASDYQWPRDEIAARLRVGYTNAMESWFFSRHNIALTEKQIGARLPRAQVIPVCRKVSYDADIPWPSEELPIRLAVVARLDPETKGQDLLFELLAQQRWRDRPVTVSLFGEGYHREVVRSLASLLQLDNVHLIGFVDDVESLWRTHHALVLPSRSEGLPAAIVEAMLASRPCIVTDAGGNGEVIEDDVTGFIAAGPSVSQLAEAMERAWERRLDWQTIGQAAAASIRQQVPRDPIGVVAARALELFEKAE